MFHQAVDLVPGLGVFGIVGASVADFTRLVFEDSSSKLPRADGDAVSCESRPQHQTLRPFRLQRPVRRVQEVTDGLRVDTSADDGMTQKKFPEPRPNPIHDDFPLVTGYD